MNSDVKAKFDTYPEEVKSRLLEVRGVIYSVAEEESLGEVIETLKWNEASYQTTGGSPLRLDWKEKSPYTLSLYFNCKTRLIETFKEVYRDTFIYEGNREMVLNVSEALPLLELKACISMALRYHKIKHLPLLGA